MTPGKFVTKEEWGSTLGRQATPRTHPIGATKGVTIHWEGPHMGSFPHSQCAAKVRGIEKFHEETRGWADLAYSGIVCPHGYVFEGRGIGTMTAANGNSDTNDDWYALCFLGGQGDPFTAEAQAGLIEGVQWLRSEGDAGPAVNGHRDHKATECPGDEIYRWLKNTDFGQNTTQEDDEVSWTEDIKFWRITKRGNEPKDMWAGQQLNQARGYAEESARLARIAVNEAQASRAAIQALAKTMGPTVEAAVQAAIKDAVIDVDINVNTSQES